MSRFTEFFLSSASSVIQFETLEIYHPSFSRLYRIVRNAREGLQATIETGQTVSFDYYPLRLTPIDTRDTLDYGLKVELGDLGDVIPAEIDLVMAAGTSATKPTVTYRTFRSDDLSAPLFGPVLLEITSIAMSREGASFEAVAPALNTNRTGELYTIPRFPMLRGFLT